MADVQRHRYGDAKIFLAPVASATVIEIGDNVWLDPYTRGAKPVSDLTYGATLAATQALLKLYYLGTSLSASAAGQTVPIRVATGGVHEFICASATFSAGDIVGIDDNVGGTALEDQQVIEVHSLECAIGAVAEEVTVAATTVRVEIRGQCCGLLLSLPENSSPEIIEMFDDFNGYGIYALATPPPGWAAVDTSAAGAPTITQSSNQHGGAVECKHAANDEAEAIGINGGDELLYDIDLLLTAEFRFRAPTISAVDAIIIGMGSAHDDDPDSITAGAWFHMDGAMSIMCESDDGTVDNDDKDSLVDLGNDVWCNGLIDYTDKDDVKYYLDVTGLGVLLRVLATTTFDMGVYTAGLQPMAFLTKSGGTTTINLDVDYFRVRALRH